MATYQELIAQRAALEKQQADLDKQIAETLKAERNHAIDQIKALMVEHGITTDDLGAKPGKPAKSGAMVKQTRKVAAKFRDPSTGDTWSGRGLKPRWLAAALESGRKLEEFAL